MPMARPPETAPLTCSTAKVALKRVAAARTLQPVSQHGRILNQKVYRTRPDVVTCTSEMLVGLSTMRIRKVPAGDALPR